MIGGLKNMKVLVIPDIHLKPWMFDRAEELLHAHAAEQAVCLMDIADDWNMQLNVDLYRKSYDRAIAFAKAFPDTIWCYGNHDVSYPWGKLETGYSPYAERTVIDKMDELKATLKEPSQIGFIQKIGKVLFSHGGLTKDYVTQLDRSLHHSSIEVVLDAVNHAPIEMLWYDASPLWLRSQYQKVEPFRKEQYIQVVGHTPVNTIYEKNGFISTDVFSIKPNGNPIGDETFLVIDTETGIYDRIKKR